MELRGGERASSSTISKPSRHRPPIRHLRSKMVSHTPQSQRATLSGQHHGVLPETLMQRPGRARGLPAHRNHGRADSLRVPLGCRAKWHTRHLPSY